MTDDRPVKELGELALRVENLDEMTEFYRDVVGLEVLRRFDDCTFFRLREGYGGHTQIVALFDRAGGDEYVPPDPARTTVDHFAFTIDLADFETERDRLESLGIELDFATHEWVSWRSLYFSDPEENRVEFVCYDESVGE
ncbi:VOC family protein [Haloarchaeobius sp. HME9146]|uniref:VOC family protein n=1 Tax=Haloarchaeobius sp. HME9146 TaxID=2978732 RepID=UPI0021C033C4|nr:VOC family protein [Haloarchaeobius sp. HME9146]MCT9095990.1 VOC family protein [Haloarchaeobius sp. HME9146]